MFVVGVVLASEGRRVGGDGVEVGWDGLGAKRLEDGVEGISALVADAIPFL